MPLPRLRPLVTPDTRSAPCIVHAPLQAGKSSSGMRHRSCQRISLLPSSPSEPGDYTRKPLLILLNPVIDVRCRRIERILWRCLAEHDSSQRVGKLGMNLAICCAIEISNAIIRALLQHGNAGILLEVGIVRQRFNRWQREPITQHIALMPCTRQELDELPGGIRRSEEHTSE